MIICSALISVVAQLRNQCVVLHCTKNNPFEVNVFLPCLTTMTLIEQCSRGCFTSPLSYLTYCNSLLKGYQGWLFEPLYIQCWTGGEHTDLTLNDMNKSILEAVKNFSSILKRTPWLVKRIHGREWATLSSTDLKKSWLNASEASIRIFGSTCKHFSSKSHSLGGILSRISLLLA